MTSISQYTVAMVIIIHIIGLLMPILCGDEESGSGESIGKLIKHFCGCGFINVLNI